MAIVTITIDTEENTLRASIDGKDVNEVTSASAYMYNDYYTKNKPKVSWNISANNATNDDDFSSYVNYCSATASIKADGKVEIVLSGAAVAKEVVKKVKASLTKEIIERAKSDTNKYILSKRGK
jgi:hypothetical protein